MRPIDELRAALSAHEKICYELVSALAPGGAESNPKALEVAESRRSVERLVARFIREGVRL